MVIVCCVTLAMSLVTAASAQQVRSAIGVRVGYPNALSLKYFVTQEIALEAMAGFRPYIGTSLSSTNVRLGGFYHYDLELDDEFEPLRLMAGASAGLIFWNYGDDFFVGRDRNGFSRTSLGLRLHLGGQYAFQDVPLELTLDVGPRLWLGDIFYNSFAVHSSLGVRYIIGRQ